MFKLSHSHHSVNDTIDTIHAPFSKPCIEPGCTGIQVYREATTCFHETVGRFECLVCGRTTDARLGVSS